MKQYFKSFNFVLTLIIIMLLVLTYIDANKVYKAYTSKIYQLNETIVSNESKITNLQNQLNFTTITPSKLKDIILTLQPKLDPLIAIEIATVIINECEIKSIDPALVTALIYIESVFDPFAKSNKDAIGLMQIRYEAWKESPLLKNNDINARESLFWLDKNIKAGINILKKYYVKSGCDIRYALYRYNTGKTDKPNTWQMEYVNKILYYTYWIRCQIDKNNLCLPDVENNVNDSVQN